MSNKRGTNRSSESGQRSARKGRSSLASPARKANTTRSGPGAAVLAFLLGAGAATGAGYLYLHSTPPAPPASPASQPAPVPTPASSLPAPNPPHAAPFGTSEDVFEAGAHLYAARCAGCHGTSQKDAAGQPPAQQLWRQGRHTVASQIPSDLYREIASGAPAKGMPAFAKVLTDTQVWQLALLLKNADQDLPDPVVAILKTSPAHQLTSAASR